MPHSDHDTVPRPSWQLHDVTQQAWAQEIEAQLPAGYQEQARQTRAFVRVRGLPTVSALLRGLLAYVLCVCSFREVGAWALLIGLANLSHVAWQKRLQKARPFLLWLLMQRLAIQPVPLSPSAAVQRIVLIDATRLKEPGGTGDDRRVHLGYDLLAGRLVDVTLSDGHTAEGLTLFDLQAGDLVVADRGYSRSLQWAFALSKGAHLVVRVALSQIRLLDEQGTRFDALAWLRAHEGQSVSCPIAFEHAGRLFPGRLIACPLPPEKARQARERERKKASKGQRALKKQTLYLCGWLLLFCSLPAELWSDEQALALYRARWQIELVIKRMKQQLKLAQLRGRTTCTNEAILLALLLAWSWLEPEVEQARRLLSEAHEQWACAHEQARLHPPEALNPDPSAPDPSHEEQARLSPPEGVLSPLVVSRWTTTGLCVHTLRVMVQGYWTWAHLRRCLPWLRRYLCSRRHRGHQETTIRRQLGHLLSRLGSHSSGPFLASSP